MPLAVPTHNHAVRFQPAAPLDPHTRSATNRKQQLPAMHMNQGVAMLPLQNIRPDPKDECLTDGMTEELGVRRTLMSDDRCHDCR